MEKMSNNDEVNNLIEALRTLLSKREGFYPRNLHSALIENEVRVFDYVTDRRRKSDFDDRISTQVRVTRYYPFADSIGESYLCVETITKLPHPYGELRHGHTLTSEGDFKMLEEIFSQHDAFWEFTSAKYSIE